jgi:Holliday junction resolvase RusA-like endonuclease
MRPVLPREPEVGLQPDVLRGGDPFPVAEFTGDARVDPAGDRGAGERGVCGGGAKRLRLVIHGEPASKSNQREIVTFGRGEKKRPALIKSKKAREYERAAIPQVLAQCARAGWRCLAVGKVRATIRVFYASERPDLDESVILDVLQGIVYSNDRMVRERHTFHGIDKANPRAEIEIEPIVEQGALW